MLATVKAILPQREWAKRFAYRAMLIQPSIDSISARLIADSQFDDAGDLEPEAAAEIFTSLSVRGTGADVETRAM